MKILNSLSLVVLTVVSVGFTGCGSVYNEDNFLFYDESGIASYSDNTGGNLAFLLNAIGAEPTIENGQKVEEIVTQNQQSVYSFNANNLSNSQDIALIINKLVAQKVDSRSYSSNKTINESEPCSDGGTINYSGSGSDTGGATITIT